MFPFSSDKKIDVRSILKRFWGEGRVDSPADRSNFGFRCFHLQGKLFNVPELVSDRWEADESRGDIPNFLNIWMPLGDGNMDFVADGFKVRCDIAQTEREPAVLWDIYVQVYEQDTHFNRVLCPFSPKSSQLLCQMKSQWGCARAKKIMALND